MLGIGLMLLDFLKLALIGLVVAAGAFLAVDWLLARLSDRLFGHGR